MWQRIVFMALSHLGTHQTPGGHLAQTAACCSRPNVWCFTFRGRVLLLVGRVAQCLAYHRPVPGFLPFPAMPSRPTISPRFSRFLPRRIVAKSPPRPARIHRPAFRLRLSPLQFLPSPFRVRARSLGPLSAKMCQRLRRHVQEG